MAAECCPDFDPGRRHSKVVMQDSHTRGMIANKRDIDKVSMGCKADAERHGTANNWDNL